MSGSPPDAEAAAGHRRLRFATAAALFLVCSVLYFGTRSPALDEWDSVQFALGVGDFDLWQHQPHPPGYPVYIASGWLGAHLLPLTVPDALALASALGGGLFVAGWFLLLARRFSASIAFVTATALATLLITWMTAAKVLTDGLEAGLLALTLLALEYDADAPENARQRLVAGALIAALAAGVRPQNAGIILLILVLAIARSPSPPRRWTLGVGCWVAGCLGWLLPTCWLQAHTRSAAGDWWAYPRQLLFQWHWRLDQPKAFLGATGQTKDLLMYRLEHHLLGWFTRGFGFPLDTIWGWVGLTVVVLGWTFYALTRLGPIRPPTPARETTFWRRHLPWAAAYIALIFCCLPGDQRYYLPIFPLLLLPVVAGWHAVLGRARWLVWFLPVATLAITLPFALEAHREPAPPVRLLRWLEAAWPPAERPHVCLILGECRRHAQWYAPEFRLLPAEDAARLPAGSPFPPPATAIYTDDPAIAAQPSPDGRWLLLETFRRSPLIYRKHSEVFLYIFQSRKTPPETLPSHQP